MSSYQERKKEGNNSKLPTISEGENEEKESAISSRESGNKDDPELVQDESRGAVMGLS